MASNTHLDDLKARLLDVYDLRAAAAVLSWDQTTYMPPGGAAARGRQMAVLERLAHEAFTDKGVGKLLDALEPELAGEPDDSDDKRLVQVTRRDYERALRVPADFLGELTTHGAAAYQVWTEARPENDFAKVRPYLEKTLELSRRYAGFFPGYAHIADPLIDLQDEGMTVAAIRPLFAELREALVPLVQAITSQAPADDGALHHYYPEAGQLDFGLEVIRAYGFDFRRGRQDKTHHPFCTTFSTGDVRITTRVKERDLGDALFSTLHESGHAMYEQGIDPAFEGTPLADGTSAGVHESQSRLWENLVGRSRGFWEHYYAALQAAFPDQLRSVPLEEFYRAVNKVSRSLIRTDADEVTYNLHVIIRFGLELDLLEGRLEVGDLPEAWRAHYQESLGIQAEDDKDGVLQDVHWYAGVVGGVFQGYTLGNILSAQFFEAALAERPEVPDDIRQGRFDGLHGWLKENIYRHGRKYTAAEIVERATGKPMTIEPYLRYLREKFGEIYAI